MDNQRRKKIRRLVSELNKIRRKQKQKIDILCNDMVSSHKNFISNLQSFRFAADFYEGLIGINELDNLAEAVGDFFTSNIKDSNVAIVFAGSASAQPLLHFYGSSCKLEDTTSHLSNSLTGRITELVCQSNKICTAEELYKMGFVVSPAVMKKISLAAIGMSGPSGVRAMLVLYRNADDPLRESELKKAASVMPGLAKAVKNCPNKAQCSSV